MPIDEITKFQIGEMNVEVNWNEAVKPCKKFKFKIGNRTAIIDYADLYGMLFMFGDTDAKEKLMPIKMEKIVMAKRQVRIRATKEIKKGDILRTTYEYPISEDIFYKLKDPLMTLSNKSIDSHIAGK